MIGGGSALHNTLVKSENEGSGHSLLAASSIIHDSSLYRIAPIISPGPAIISGGGNSDPDQQ